MLCSSSAHEGKELRDTQLTLVNVHLMGLAELYFVNILNVYKVSTIKLAVSSVIRNWRSYAHWPGAEEVIGSAVSVCLSHILKWTASVTTGIMSQLLFMVCSAEITTQ